MLVTSPLLQTLKEGDGAGVGWVPGWTNKPAQPAQGLWSAAMGLCASSSLQSGNPPFARGIALAVACGVQSRCCSRQRMPALAQVPLALLRSPQVKHPVQHQLVLPVGRNEKAGGAVEPSSSCHWAVQHQIQPLLRCTCCPSNPRQMLLGAKCRSTWQTPCTLDRCPAWCKAQPPQARRPPEQQASAVLASGSRQAPKGSSVQL